MKNVKDLRFELVKMFTGLKKNEIDVKVAKTSVAISNSILKSCALEIEHAKLTGKSKDIDFLISDE